jgi:hypothetical protein
VPSPMTVSSCCLTAGWLITHYADHLLLTMLGERTRNTQQPQVRWAWCYSATFAQQPRTIG